MAAKPAAPKAKTRKKTTASVRTKAFVKTHKDGTLWAKGQTKAGIATGYWEWFRKDGTKLRSGYFEKGEQTGEWTTYDQKGRVYKVTNMKPKAKMMQCSGFEKCEGL